MDKYWGEDDIHFSSDTAIALGAGESRLTLPSKISWDAYLGTRQMAELYLDPRQRKYHRYCPFPLSVRSTLDEWSRERIRLSLHHQLLTGVVVYVDARYFANAELSGLDFSVIKGRAAVITENEYRPSRLRTAESLANEHPQTIANLFDRSWELVRGPAIMRLYYRYPQTFQTERYYPAGMRRFIAFLQNYQCRCDDRCDLNKIDWDVDHVVPCSSGGTNVLTNLQAACRAYNRERKRNRYDPTPVNYWNVLNDPDWKPKLSPLYQSLLLNQRLGLDDLSSIRRLAVATRNLI